MPNHLVVYDVDDTLFTVGDLGVVMRDEEGNFVKNLSMEEFDSISPESRAKYSYTFDAYNCSATFKQGSSPLQDMIRNCIRDLNDSDKTVVFVTARDGIDNMQVYVDHFHSHGMKIDHDQVHFCGIKEVSHLSSPALKRPVFERLLDETVWNSATIYDDNRGNLAVFRDLSIDRDIPSRAFWVDPEGIPRNYYG